MHHFESWEHGWHYFPLTVCIIFLILAIYFFFFYRKKGFIFDSRWFRHNWSRNWSADCYSGRRSESASEILKKRYARGEINKEVFEQMKSDISETT